MKKYFPVLLACLQAGCSKTDTSAPVISLSSPVEHAVFAGGQTVHITGTITDNEGIHMVHVTVLDESTNGHLLHFEEHTDSKLYQLNQQFQVAAGRSYMIEVSAEDHDQNAANKELEVSGQ